MDSHAMEPIDYQYLIIEAQAQVIEELKDEIILAKNKIIRVMGVCKICDEPGIGLVNLANEKRFTCDKCLNTFPKNDNHRSY